MNERIKQIATEAAAYTDVSGRWVSANSMNKFAELIIHHCYEHCKGQLLDKEVADTNELSYNDAVMDCANGLLQHFGIDV